VRSRRSASRSDKERMDNLRSGRSGKVRMNGFIPVSSREPVQLCFSTLSLLNDFISDACIC
jgi:hypothetical protein